MPKDISVSDGLVRKLVKHNPDGQDIDETDMSFITLAMSRNVEIWWAHQGLIKGDIPELASRDMSTRVLKGQRAGTLEYMRYMVFIANHDEAPLEACGRVGDIWVSICSIYYRDITGWKTANMARSQRPQHPYLPRRALTLDISDASPGWPIRRTSDQWYSKIKRELNSMTNLSGTGLEMDVRQNYATISSTTVARYIRKKRGMVVEEHEETEIERGTEENEVIRNEARIEQPATGQYPHGVQGSFSGWTGQAVSETRLWFNGENIAMPRKLPGVVDTGSTMEDELVDWMSRGQSATESMVSEDHAAANSNIGTPYTPLHIIQWPSTISAEVYNNLLDHVRSLMSRAQSVAIAGVPDELPIEWVTEDIASIMTGRRTFLGVPMTWQSMTKRHYSLTAFRAYLAAQEKLEANEISPEEMPSEPTVDFHERGTLQDFVNIITEGQDCISCLEWPRVDGEAPTILRGLADDVISWNTTDALQFTLAAHNAGRCREKYACEIYCQASGPRNMDKDITSSRRWGILSDEGFFTPGHADASGFGTWGKLLTGVKAWGYIYPKSMFSQADCRTASKAWVELTEATDYINNRAEERVPSVGEVKNFLLEPRTLLLQPPGLTHQVYTLKKAIMIGGHFLMFETLHLTEWNRLVAHVTERVGTNNDHTGVQKTLARMMIALAIQGPTKVLRKPFMSLCRMLINPSDYWGADYTLAPGRIPPLFQGNHKGATAEIKESQREQQEARHIATAILHANGLPTELTPIHPTAEGWNIAEFGIWNEPGDVMIDIPKFEIVFV